jgi:UDP-N-acetylglucosamine 1-carboxyvinyltransferase
MGADVTTTASAVVLRASKLEGTHVRFAFPSVGATENVLLAAVLAKGTTVIDNAAVEPEVLDLVHFLQQMGALVSVGVERRITIEGVSRLRGADHTAITDRIEAASFAAAAVATDGSVEVVGARQDVLGSFLNTLRKVGGEFEVTPRGLRFFRAHELIAQHVETSVHPGFMTDWQQPLVVLLTQARGASVIHETVYENRFGYTEQLNEMGGQIALSTHCLGGTPCRYRSKDFRHSAVVMGPTPLTGANLEIPDLRAGFAYVMAALVANGESTVRGTRYLERGYEDPVGKLLAMGAQIETCPLSVAPQPTVVA